MSDVFGKVEKKNAELISMEIDLQTEIERLREALEKITKHRVNHFLNKDLMLDSMFDIAKKALEK